MRPGTDSKIGPFVAGTRPKASWLNWMLTQIKKFANITVIEPLSFIDSPDGLKLTISKDLYHRTGTVVKVDTSNNYIWVEPDFPALDGTTGLPFYIGAGDELSWEVPNDPAEEPDPVHIKVFVEGIESVWFKAFYKIGDIIEYWTSDDGYYITNIYNRDVEFWAEISTNAVVSGETRYSWTASTIDSSDNWNDEPSPVPSGSHSSSTTYAIPATPGVYNDGDIVRMFIVRHLSADTTTSDVRFVFIGGSGGNKLQVDLTEDGTGADGSNSAAVTWKYNAVGEDGSTYTHLVPSHNRMKCKTMKATKGTLLINPDGSSELYQTDELPNYGPCPGGS